MKPLVLAAAAAAAFALPAPVLAQDAPAEGPPPVIRPTDGAMTCPRIADEAAQLSESMGGSEGGVFGRLGGVARSGAALVVPGAGLAMAGVDALTHDARERREAEKAAAQNRWWYLNGLYAGRGCDRPQANPPTPQ